MKKEFKPMSDEGKWNTYGGFSVNAAVMLPMIIQSVVAAISSLKMLGSQKGSINYNGYKSDWSSTSKESTKETKSTHETYYSF